MKIQYIDIGKIKKNPKNPRIIKDEKFEKLVQSVKSFPKMLELRPIIVDSKFMVLGGNQRFEACKSAEFKSVPVIIADDLTPKQKKEFILKDNLSSGEWDFILLQEQFEPIELKEFGLYIPDIADIDPNEFFDDVDHKKDETHKIVLEYSSKMFKKVSDALAKYPDSKESVIAKLLGV